MSAMISALNDFRSEHRFYAEIPFTPSFCMFYWWTLYLLTYAGFQHDFHMVSCCTVFSFLYSVLWNISCFHGFYFDHCILRPYLMYVFWSTLVSSTFRFLRWHNAYLWWYEYDYIIVWRHISNLIYHVYSTCVVYSNSLYGGTQHS